MYLVYCLTLNNKKYIGYTGGSLNNRIKQHIKLANSNKCLSYLQRAIKKHGSDKIQSDVLYSTKYKKCATKKEKYYIKYFHSTNPNKGYNLTYGGDGGNCTKLLSKKKKEIWCKKLSIKSTKNNPNSSGYNDDFLINEAVKFFIKNKSLGRRAWVKFSKESGYPQSFSKNRFNGSFDFFVNLVQNKLTKLNIRFKKSDFDNKKNTYSKETKSKIASAIKGRKWFNDGCKSYQIFPDDSKIIELKLKNGRINVKN